MPNLNKVVKLTQSQYNTLAQGGTVGGMTGLSSDCVYLVEDDNSYYTSDQVDDLVDEVYDAIGGGQITIQKNGSNIDSFNVNQSNNKTINITVPTNTNQLTNGAGYITGITSSMVVSALGYTPSSFSGDYNDLSNKPTSMPTSDTFSFRTTSTLGAVVLQKNGVDYTRTTVAMPTSLPANGGNSDTVDGYHASDLVKTIITLNNGADLNTIVTSGFYRMSSSVVNGPSGADWSQLIVSRGSDTIAQIVISYGSEGMAYRNGNPSDVGGSGSWSAWKRVIDSNNIGSQSVNYATSAGSAPANGGNADYATTAGSAPANGGNADTVDSKHASDFTNFYLSPMTSGAPADSAKSWFANTMPSASGAIVYNVPGSEKTIIAGKSSGSYGHMLQLNYDDNYLRILRYYAGSWQTTDWEKISAGYADSAGYATSAGSAPANGGNADTVDGYHASDFAPKSSTVISGNGTAYSSVSTSYVGGVSSGPLTGGWDFVWRAEHRNGADDGPSYIAEIMSAMTSSGDLYWRKKYGGSSFTSFAKIIDSNNIGSQSVNYATSAGSANSVAWGNVSGRPTFSFSNGVLTITTND